MTYLDRIKKDKINIFQIQKDLKKMLESNVWTSHFCHCSQDHIQSYTDSLKTMKQRVAFSEAGYMSSIYSEDLALCLIKSCLDDNLSHIANFLLSDDTSMELMGLMTDGPVGYIVNRKRAVEEVSSVIISIRKNDKPCRNSSGFYVEYAYPVRLP